MDSELRPFSAEELAVMRHGAWTCPGCGCEVGGAEACPSGHPNPHARWFLTLEAAEGRRVEEAAQREAAFSHARAAWAVTTHDRAIAAKDQSDKERAQDVELIAELAVFSTAAMRLLQRIRGRLRNAGDDQVADEIDQFLKNPPVAP